jgi:drug/metabolite transporter (DMT)-like permease
MNHQINSAQTIVGGMLMVSSLFGYCFYRVARPRLAGGMTPKIFAWCCFIGIIGGALLIIAQFIFPEFF